MNEWLETVSCNIKALKKSHGWNQETLADKAGISKSVIRDLEAGNDRATSSLDTISRIAEALGVSLSDLLASETVKPIIKPLPVSETLQKLMAIPDDVYDKAIVFGSKHEVWDEVRAALNDALKDIELNKEANA